MRSSLAENLPLTIFTAAAVGVFTFYSSPLKPILNTRISLSLTFLPTLLLEKGAGSIVEAKRALRRVYW